MRVGQWPHAGLALCGSVKTICVARSHCPCVSFEFSYKETVKFGQSFANSSMILIIASVVSLNSSPIRLYSFGYSCFIKCISA